MVSIKIKVQFFQQFITITGLESAAQVTLEKPDQINAA